MIGLHDPSKKYINSQRVQKVINSGWLSSSGPEARLFENYIKKFTNSKYAISTINGTSALHLAIACLYPKKNDEILLPDISFISTVNSVHYNFCNPIFIGVNKNFLICEKKLEEFIEKKTFFKNGFTFSKTSKKKIIAIIVVHTFGNLVHLYKIKKILKKKNIKIIEDAAESLGSFYINKKTIHSGLVGDIGCLSFNINKIITTGGGGMVITKSKKYYKVIKHIANQSKKDPIKFIHDQIGFNYAMPSINAAIGINQIKNIKKIIIKKKSINRLYQDKFKNTASINFLSDSKKNNVNFWLNLIQFDFKTNCTEKIVKYLNKKKISVRPVWYPLSQQPYNKKYYRYKTDDTLQIIKNVICIPSGSDLQPSQQKYIIREIEKIAKIIR